MAKTDKEEPQQWEVVGGATTNGILVRVARSLESAEAGQRLGCGAVIQQTELKGERLCYQLVRGSGPATGWVSLKLKGKDLVVRRAPARRLLLLSIPWKGHIVHLKRLAEWFEGREGYEVHFGVQPSGQHLVPKGSIAHVAQGDEAQADGFYEKIEDSFRDLAKQGVDHESGIGGMLGAMMRQCADHSSRGQEPLAQFIKFCMRLIMEVKPQVVVGDAACTFYGLIGGLCHAQGIKVIWVQSPGLREVQAEAASEKIGHDNLGADKQATGAISRVAQKAGIEMEVFAKAMGMPLDVLESMDRGQPKPMPPGVKLSFIGLAQSIATQPEFAPFLAKPLGAYLNLDVKKMIEVIGAMEAAPPPLWFLPSAISLVGQEPTPNYIYTGSFLPLPKQSGNSLQWSRATFEEKATSVSPELLAWLFSEEDTNPIVYLAFGTIVQPSEQLLQALVKCFEAGPWRVLWALPEALQRHLPADLSPLRWRVMNFVPQADALKCERVRAFISHMGANSTMEALACGVPLVCCPFYMDQFEWSHVVCKYWKAGVEVGTDRSAEAFREVVRSVVEERCYAEGATRAATAMNASAEATMLRLPELGDRLEPPPTLGVGVSVAAATILRCMDGKPVDPIFDLVASVDREVAAAR